MDSFRSKYLPGLAENDLIELHDTSSRFQHVPFNEVVNIDFLLEHNVSTRLEYEVRARPHSHWRSDTPESILVIRIDDGEFQQDSDNNNSITALANEQPLQQQRRVATAGCGPAAIVSHYRSKCR